MSPAALETRHGGDEEAVLRVEPRLGLLRVLILAEQRGEALDGLAVERAMCRGRGVASAARLHDRRPEAHRRC